MEYTEFNIDELKFEVEQNLKLKLNSNGMDNLARKYFNKNRIFFNINYMNQRILCRLRENKFVILIIKCFDYSSISIILQYVTLFS